MSPLPTIRRHVVADKSEGILAERTAEEHVQEHLPQIVPGENSQPKLKSPKSAAIPDHHNHQHEKKPRRPSMIVTQRNQEEVREMLANYKFFKELEPATLADLAQVVEFMHCQAGTVLFQQGDPPGSCYIICSGSVDICVMPEEELEEEIAKAPRIMGKATGLDDFLPGHKTVDGFSRYYAETKFGAQVAKLGPGQLFGEIALLNDGCRTAAVLCATASEFMVISRREFDNVIKVEMVRKGDQKLRFLIEHLPGMADVPVPRQGSNRPHASYYFKTGTFHRGHKFFVQGRVEAEPAIYVVFRGAVELRRAEDLGTDDESDALVVFPPKAGSKPGPLRASKSMPRLLGSRAPVGITTYMQEGGDDRGVRNRRGLVVSGGVFGSLPIHEPEPFTVQAISDTCEVFFVSGADLAKLPRKLVDTLNEYIANSAAWRLTCHRRSQSLRGRNHKHELKEMQLARDGIEPIWGHRAMKDNFQSIREKKKGHGREIETLGDEGWQKLCASSPHLRTAAETDSFKRSASKTVVMDQRASSRNVESNASIAANSDFRNASRLLKSRVSFD